ncbi:DNA repair protein RAD51 [Citrus sinensis]|uniref:DNA repair protein RAD51 n=1 Tax=Citrus sinensis TaxID=2711 RepID=A0ACB8MT66_CITSI|nr:DNA repair protein RAD51 [Citrus sinensis]KAH9788335.1 DNA repair protein RAD51 [Citrus sinensis]
MEVSKLPISATQRGKLISAGYTSLSSICSASSSDISRGTQTAWDMLQEEQESLARITTSCADLDNILGGGIGCREVTEIGGVPGIGKTQLGIQLAVNVQIPVEFGGLGGKAIYIDTEGSFMVERALQIAEACVEDMLEYNRFLRNDCQVKTQPKDILENIFYFRICSYTEQSAVINYLDKFVSEHKDVKVVIIDSIAFHFRHGFVDLALRTRVLSGIALKLMNLAKKFSLAVVLLNQVTTKYTEGSFQLCLALAMNVMHTLTSHLIFDQHQLHIQLLAEGSGIPHQEVKGSK